MDKFQFSCPLAVLMILDILSRFYEETHLYVRSNASKVMRHISALFEL